MRAGGGCHRMKGRPSPWRLAGVPVRGADEGRDDVTTSTSRTDGRPSLGDLVSDLSEKLSTLMRNEIRLAQLEMKEKAKSSGIGLGMFAGAAVVLFWAVGILFAAIILLISEALAPWIAAIIVFGVLLAIAAVLALVGKRMLDKGTPPVPERAQANIRLDIEAVRQGLAKEGTSA